MQDERPGARCDPFGGFHLLSRVSDILDCGSLQPGGNESIAAPFHREICHLPTVIKQLSSLSDGSNAEDFRFTE